jgi:hypothetical protein
LAETTGSLGTGLPIKCKEYGLPVNEFGESTTDWIALRGKEDKEKKEKEGKNGGAGGSARSSGCAFSS